MPKYAQRRDENEDELITLARAIGVLCEKAPPLDWWCFWRGAWTPVEVKREEREGRKHEFTPAQILFHVRCRERNAPFVTWRTEADVLKFCGAVRGA